MLKGPRATAVCILLVTTHKAAAVGGNELLKHCSGKQALISASECASNSLVKPY